MTPTDGVHSANETPEWRKSTYSNPSGECVQVAKLADGQVAMRNSRFPSAEILVFTRAEIVAFLKGTKDGEFDDLAR
ncbi:MAG TPA: DUF397 domain-containing protein [Pseudonocardia sp.]|jgi:hypothetical protein